MYTGIGHASNDIILAYTAAGFSNNDIYLGHTTGKIHPSVLTGYRMVVYASSVQTQPLGTLVVT